MQWTSEQHTYTSSEHFHLEEETMLALGNEIFFFFYKKNSFTKKMFRILTGLF